jgi:hypothetical protein
MYYLRVCPELPDPVVFMSVDVSTSVRINEETLCLFFLHANREADTLDGELQEESDQFIRATCLSNLKGALGLMLVKTATMRITTPLDLSTKPFIPLPRFIHTRVSQHLFLHLLSYYSLHLAGW